MPDPFRKVRPGDAVTFSATVWNEIVDLARGTQQNLSGGTLTSSRDAAIIKVQNKTGNVLPRYSVLGLDKPIFDPGTHEDAFLREIAFQGVTPTTAHADKFVVILEPAPLNRVVRAVAAGICAVKVDIIDDTITHAEAQPAHTDALVTKSDGSAHILWREGTDGAGSGYGPNPQWALVRLGSQRVDWLALGVTTTTITAATVGGADGSGTCTITYADGTSASINVGNRATTSIASGKNAMLGWIPNKGKWYIWGDC